MIVRFDRTPCGAVQAPVVVRARIVMRHGEYGYDAPYALVIFGSLTVLTGLGVAIAWWRMPSQATGPITLYFVLFLVNTTSFFYTTRRGKFIEWDRILDRTHLRGDEMVLDMGCGRGAVLTAVARRLMTGRVTGVDIWSKTDQSGNAMDVALRNVSLEGVSERVHIETADMRALPFTDATFDLVVSSLAIHNVRSNADRKRAISEAFRVLKPGGRMVIADIRATAIYADALRTLGASNVERHRLGWRFWWGIRSPPQLSSRLQNPKFEDLQRVSETIDGRQAFLFVGAARA
jgi:SAM-dependent methyltransferase